MPVSREEAYRNYYVWEFVYCEIQRKDLPSFFKYLIDKKPKPTPYIAENLGKNGEAIKICVNWNYLTDSKNQIIGFISIIQECE
jgi:hypothetical protein